MSLTLSSAVVRPAVPGTDALPAAPSTAGLTDSAAALDLSRLPAAGLVLDVVLLLLLLAAGGAGWRRGVGRVVLGVIGGAAGAVVGVPVARWVLGVDALAAWSAPARTATGLNVLVVVVALLAGTCASFVPSGPRAHPRLPSRLAGGGVAVLAAAVVLAVAVPLVGLGAEALGGVAAEVGQLSGAPTAAGALLARVVGAPAAVVTLGAGG